MTGVQTCALPICFPVTIAVPATLAEVQAMITAVNTAQANILAQIGNEGDNPDAVNSVVTAAQLATLSGIIDVVNANEDAYQMIKIKNYFMSFKD